MATASISKKPEILVIAGPNGSGKTTITSLVKYIGTYINADDIKKVLNCSDLEAAEIAEAQRENHLKKRENFTFEFDKKYREKTVIIMYYKIGFEGNPINQLLNLYFIRATNYESPLAQSAITSLHAIPDSV